jgi:hypothetical protein
VKKQLYLPPKNDFEASSSLASNCPKMIFSHGFPVENFAINVDNPSIDNIVGSKAVFSHQGSERASSNVPIDMGSTLLEALNVRVEGSGQKVLILAHGFDRQRILSSFTPYYRIILYDLVCAGSINPDYFDFRHYTTLNAYVDDLVNGHHPRHPRSRSLRLRRPLHLRLDWDFGFHSSP